MRSKGVLAVGIALLLMAGTFFGPFGPHGIPIRYWIAMRQCDNVEMLTIDPDPRPDPNNPMDYKSLGDCNGYAIIGEARLKPVDRVRLLDDLQEGGHWSLSLVKVVTKCGFQPRHALRFHLAADHTCDVLICFHCRHMRMFDGEREVLFDDSFDAPRTAFDEIRQAYKLPLAP